MTAPTAGLRAALAWLAHPATVLATVLLVLNDHVLKAAAPGFVTGKLSDIAGLVLAPALVAVALTTIRVPARIAGVLACGLVGAGYSAVKASPVVAGYASAGWSLVNGPSTVAADGTDLLVLPALGLAWLVWRHARTRPPRDRLWRLFVALVVLPVSSLAVAATSAPIYEDAIAVTVWHGRIVVGIGNAYHPGSGVDFYQTSPDAGRSFAAMASGDLTAFLGELPALPTAATTGCQPGASGHCFRVVSGRLRVEESTDGGVTWRVAWQVTEAERQRLAARYPEVGNPDVYLSSVALAVLDQPGGCVVLVANGRDGFLRRDVSGAWTRIGFGTDAATGYARPAPAIPPPSVPSVTAALPPVIAAGLIVGGWVVLLGAGAALVRGGRARQLWASAPLVAVGSLLAWIFGRVAGPGAAVPLILLGWLFAVAVTGTGVVLCLWLAVNDWYLRRRGALFIPLVGLGTWLAVVAPFAGAATVGWPAHRVPVAVTAALVGAAGSVALGLRFRSVAPAGPSSPMAPAAGPVEPRSVRPPVPPGGPPPPR